MTEYELVDAMNGTVSAMMSSQGLFLSVLFAYLLAAYTVGSKLTQFQAAFISLVFLFFTLAGSSAMASMSNEVSYYGSAIADIRGSDVGGGIPANLVAPMLVLVRLLMATGALYFMWQVRHPKTE